MDQVIADSALRSSVSLIMSLKREAMIWCVIFACLLGLALAEWQLMHGLGIEYVPKDTIQRVSVSDFSLSADGRFAASRVGIRRGLRGRITNDIFWHDLKNRTSHALDLSDISPNLVCLAPDAASIAIGTNTGSIYRAILKKDRSGVMTVQGRELLLEARSSSPLHELRYSLDGRLLMATGEGTIYLLAIADATDAGVRDSRHDVITTGPESLPKANSPEPVYLTRHSAPLYRSDRSL